MIPIRVEIRVPERFRNRAAYVFRTFSSIWGIPLRIAPPGAQDPPDIAYGNEFPDQRQCRAANSFR